MTTFSPGDRVRVYAPHLRGEGEVLYHVPAGDRAPERYRVKLDASPRTRSIAAKYLRPVERPAPPVNELTREPWYDLVTGVPVAKDHRWRSPTYLAWIRSQPCQACHASPPNEASHHPEEGHGSMGMKCGDDRVMSLCTECHHEHHAGRGKTLDRYWVERVVGRMFRTYVLQEMGLGKKAS